MSAQPVIEGNTFDGPLSFWHDYAVVYPAGSVYHEGRWLVSVGIHDRSLGFAMFDHESLLASCLSF